MGINMDEILPIGVGLVVGCLFASVPRSRAAAVLARALWIFAAGIFSTVLSGEFRTNWGFAIIDIGEVGLAAWVATFLTDMLLARIVRKPRAAAPSRTSRE